MYISITFKNIATSVAEMVIAQLQYHAEGFEEKENELTITFLKENYIEDIIQNLALNYQLHYERATIAPQNWNALWESNFAPVVIDDFVGIRASFHPPIKNVLHEIVITPKMSFGTGHHATTHLVIQQMQKINFKGKKVFDFGTGTGVLAILAKKLGATSVWANDIDEWSILNAQENFEQNQSADIQLIQSGSAKIDDRFDIILANINRNVLLQNMEELAQRLNHHAQLILSGILTEDFNIIKEKAQAHRLQLLEKNMRNQWLCLLFIKE